MPLSGIHAPPPSLPPAGGGWRGVDSGLNIAGMTPLICFVRICLKKEKPFDLYQYLRATLLKLNDYADIGNNTG